MFVRNSAFVVILLIAGAVGAGCLFSSPSAGSLVSRATGKALDADTVHFELSVAVEGDIDANESDFVNMSAHGGVDSANETSVFVFESADFELEVRTLGEVTYIGAAGDSWVELETSQFLELSEFFGPLFDPYALLNELGIDPASVTREGADEVRGKKAERFSIEVPARKYDQDVEGFLELTKDTTIRFWIGEDGLPARVVIESKGTGDDYDIEASGEVTMRLTIDLFDYGKPVDVEAPPEEEIGAPPSLGGFGIDSLGDPFEGAECYGDRIDECLEPDPATEAVAQDPAACLGLDVRVCLVPVGKVRPDVVKAIVDFHKEMANIDVVVLPSLKLTSNDIRYETSQVSDLTLRRKMEGAYGVGDGTASTFIAITPIDVVPDDDEFSWMFGSRFGTSAFGHNHGVFSYFRMVHVEPYNGDPITDELIHLRAAKYVARYTAILHLDHPLSDDIDYLNYSDMYGFSDLDSIGTKWPEGDPPCRGYRKVICVYPDGDYTDAKFVDDVQAATERIAKETGLPIEFRAPSLRYIPTKPDWGTEYAADITLTVKDAIHNPQFVVVGVTDDNLSQDASVPASVDRWFGDVQMSIVSGYGAGTPGTAQHQERLYRLIVRGVLAANFGMELNDDPASLMYRGIASVEELDGKVIPPIPD